MAEQKTKKQKRIIFHVDCDYFFAQIEEKRKPELSGKPVVVCVYSGRTADSGAVGTANYAARALGINSGMPIAFAKKKASSDTIFLPIDLPYYAKVSEKIISACLHFSDKLQKASIDEAFLDVTQKCNESYQKARQLAIDLKKEILEQTGITVSVGIGPNKLIAKIASGRKKPDGMTVVQENEVKNFLAGMLVKEIPGVGKKTEELLSANRITTIKDLSEESLEKLVKLFGKAKGNYLFNASRGIDESELEESADKKRLSVIRTMKTDCTEVAQMNEYLESLCTELHLRASKQNVFFKTVFIIAIDTHLETFSRAKTLESKTDSVDTIFVTAKKLFEEIFTQKKGLILRRAGVGVINFLEKNQKTSQKSLFDFA